MKKTVFTTLFGIFISFNALAIGSMEKCKAIEQVPNVLTTGTFGRVLVVSSEDSLNLVLLMKVNETGEIKSLPMEYRENPDRKPYWQNGPLLMTIDFNLGYYHIFLSQRKILTIACG